MAKKKTKVTQAEATELANEQAKPQSDVKDPGADIESVEVTKVDILKAVESFNPRDCLRTVGNGVWRYILPKGQSITKSCFESDLAKQYGIKKNDIVFIVSDGKVLTIGV